MMFAIGMRSGFGVFRDGILIVRNVFMSVGF